MAAYLVLTSPDAGRTDDDVRFIADGFSLPAFVFPALWLLVKRQWIAGIAVAAIQVAAGLLTAGPNTLIPGLLIELALRLLVSLEGPAFILRRLEARGWTWRSVIVADDLTTAEMIWDGAADDTPADPWHPAAFPGPEPVRPGDAVGLFAGYGER